MIQCDERDTWVIRRVSVKAGSSDVMARDRVGSARARETHG